MFAAAAKYYLKIVKIVNVIGEIGVPAKAAGYGILTLIMG
jgi:hypothetical protein